MAAKPEHQDDEAPKNLQGYKAPAVKPLTEIVVADSSDQSLQQYKAKLLGSASTGNAPIPFPNDPRRVIVVKLSIMVDGRAPLELDLRGDLSQLRKSPLVLKEGVTYRVKITFYVQREIVAGLKYVQQSYRGPLKVDKMDLMVGSYAPKNEAQEFLTPPEEAPSGMLARGSYRVHSKFTDDDKHDHLTWDWELEVKKDWD
jgi:Rho GDP-dissociation inhibitor